MLHTTFEQLRSAGACGRGYHKLAKSLGGIRKYGRRTPISLITVLNTNDFSDALWSLRATTEDSEQFVRLLARDFDKRSRSLLPADFPDNTDEQPNYDDWQPDADHVYYAAYAIVHDAGIVALRNSSLASYSSETYDIAADKERKWQADRFRTLLNNENRD